MGGDLCQCSFMLRSNLCHALLIGRLERCYSIVSLLFNRFDPLPRIFPSLLL